MIKCRGATADCTPWSAAECARLRAAYTKGGIRAALSALPYRSEKSLYKKARRLGLRRHRGKWTELDFARLRKLWNAEMSLRRIAKALGSTPKTVYWYSRKLKLPTVPAGYEYLTHAADRAGFDTLQLRTILDAADVELRPVLARPSQRRGCKAGKRHRFYMVWPADVDDAIEAWLQRENVVEATARLGISERTLVRRLRAISVEKPGESAKAHWRLTPEDVARALRVKMVRTRGERGRYSGAVLSAGVGR